MGEERKEYSIVGTVTISTDEYRDLIADKFEAEKSKDYWCSQYYEKNKEVSKLT